MNLKLFIAILFIFSLLFYNCKAEKTVDESIIKNEVGEVLDNWHESAAEANFETYFDAMDKGSVFIGTDASENWDKEAFMSFSKPHFDKGKAWDFKSIERNIYIDTSQKVIWFDEVLDTWMGLCRGSGVLVKKDDDWKIKHYVLSVTVPNDDMNLVIEAKRNNDSIALEQLKE